MTQNEILAGLQELDGSTMREMHNLLVQMINDKRKAGLKGVGLKGKQSRKEADALAEGKAQVDVSLQSSSGRCVICGKWRKNEKDFYWHIFSETVGGDICDDCRDYPEEWKERLLAQAQDLYERVIKPAEAKLEGFKHPLLWHCEAYRILAEKEFIIPSREDELKCIESGIEYQKKHMDSADREMQKLKAIRARVNDRVTA